jgi:transcription elongation factor Elf1
MVCYICDRPASACCRRCSRWICASDTKVVSGELVCRNCDERARDSLAAQQNEIDRLSSERKCAFCGALDIHRFSGATFLLHSRIEDDFRNHRCAVCGKYFCPRCGSVTQRCGYRSAWGESSINDYKRYTWTRCVQHKEELRPRRELGLLGLLLPRDKNDPEQFEPPDEWEYEK